MNAEAGISRSRTITWNAVPWYIGNGNRIRAASCADLLAGQRHLEELLTLLPRLTVVVLVGRKAQRFARAIAELAPSVQVLSCPHPSPLSFNRLATRRLEVLACLSRVAAILT